MDSIGTGAGVRSRKSKRQIEFRFLACFAPIRQDPICPIPLYALLRRGELFTVAGVAVVKQGDGLRRALVPLSGPAS
jgi:hypothetical protein